MRVITIGFCVGAGALLLAAWVLALFGTIPPLASSARGMNVVLFLGGTGLLLTGIVVAVTALRPRRRIRG